MDNKNIGSTNETAVSRELKIGNTTYRLISKYEGRKTIDEILKALAVRQTARPKKQKE